MEKLELPSVHEHPLLPFSRFHNGSCSGCRGDGYLYGGYRCNELGCDTAFHKACAESDPEISHYSHPGHPLKLVLQCVSPLVCHMCSKSVGVGYTCSICDFNLHLHCAKITQPPPPPPPAPSTLENLKVHEHPLELHIPGWSYRLGNCKVCDEQLYSDFIDVYQCLHCNFYFHRTCIIPLVFPETYHSSHPKHPLKIIQSGSSSYADDKCLLCGILFKQQFMTNMLCHCGVCNFSICMSCHSNPPPLYVVSPTTHDHQLHLIPRLLNFTCNACGTIGDRSPYFCLECNFMIHRECIDLPRVININRHDHRISYTSHLGHGHDWKCGVCRKEVDGFYGGYSCTKCPTFSVHSRCATRKDVWDMVELDGTLEEEEIAPFEVIDENRIKHMSHDHELILYKDGRILHESKLCEACVSQINTDPFYNCEHCSFLLHQTCANLPRKRRHVSCNLPFTLQTNDGNDSPRQRKQCNLCLQYFTGFGYMSRNDVMDVRCGSIFEPFVHESHPHPLYYKFYNYTTDAKCDACGTTDKFGHMLCCDECEFKLEFKCATLPVQVMKQRYDDHPLLLSFGEKNVDGVYWCDVCEKKVDAKVWFYTCKACGITLHVSCVVGEFFYQMPGPVITGYGSYKVVPNTSVSRPICFRCLFRCNLPYILKVSMYGSDDNFCSLDCSEDGWELSDY